MEKLVIKTINTENETETFLDKVQSYSGVRLPENYVKNSEIVGFFLHERMVAGYMLVTKPGFRSLLFVPDSVKGSHEFFNNDDYDMMEVNGLWISPAVKSPKLQYQIWTKMIKDIFMSRKKYLLLMSDARNKTIESLHNLTNPEVLYEGAPDLMAGDKSHSTIRVGFTTRWRLLSNAPKYWWELKKRQQRAAQTARQRSFGKAGIKAHTAKLA